QEMNMHVDAPHARPPNVPGYKRTPTTARIRSCRPGPAGSQQVQPTRPDADPWRRYSRKTSTLRAARMPSFQWSSTMSAGTWMSGFAPEGGRSQGSVGSEHADADAADLQAGIAGLANLVTGSLGLDDLLARVATFATGAI